MASATDTLFRVVEPFSFDYLGVMYTMRRGQIINGDNPAYRGRAHLFEEVTAEQVRADAARTAVHATETADAVPGVPRNVTAPQAPDTTPAGPEPTAAPDAADAAVQAPDTTPAAARKGRTTRG